MSVEDLDRRGAELVAKHNKTASLEQLLDSLQHADSSVLIRPLAEVTTIALGIRASQELTSKTRPAEGAYLPVVRGADIREGKISPAQLFVVGNVGQALTHAQLRVGDVIIPAVTVGGRVQVIQQEHAGAVAASSVWVIRPNEEVSGDYLAALLRSESYQSWLTANSSSLSSAQRITAEMLERLPVPMPPLMLQDRVVRACRAEEGLDPVAALLQALTSSRHAAISRLEALPVIRILSRLPQREADGSAEDLVLLDQIGTAARETRNQLAHGGHSGLDTQHVPWLYAFARGAAILRGIARIPAGPARMSVLETARAEMERSYHLHRSTSSGEIIPPLVRTRRVIDMAAAQAEALLAGTQLDPTLEVGQIHAGRWEEIVVRLRNRSPLPLRNLIVTARPLDGKADAAFLPEGGELPVRVAVQSETAGVVPFALDWRGERLDGESISGQIALSIEVRPAMAVEDVGDLGNSPYIVGSPVESQDLFIGREELIDQVRRQLPTEHRANVILLEGNRRTGKTSILKHLQLPAVLPGWYPVYCSFQEGEGVAGRPGLPTSEVFRLMARNIGWQLESAGVRTWFPDAVAPDPGRMFKKQFSEAAARVFDTEPPVEAFRFYLERVIDACHPGRLLLMLDEFDKVQEGIDAGITSPQVPENIRNLLHDYPQFSAVLSGSRRLKRLRDEYWSALFGFGHRIGVSALSLDAARLLVTRPVEGRLVYVEEARDRLVDLAARQPFLIQSLCNRVFEVAAQTRIRVITVSAVEQAARDMVQDNEHFQTLWGYAATERRRLIMSLCVDLASGPDPITYSLFEAKLEEVQVPIPPGEQLGNDIEFLRELELIELDPGSGGAAYRLAVPLMAEWVRRNVDVADLRTKARREGEEKLA
jgi:type I restriction enzyme M protein